MEGRKQPRTRTTGATVLCLSFGTVRSYNQTRVGDFLSYFTIRDGHCTFLFKQAHTHARTHIEAHKKARVTCARSKVYSVLASLAPSYLILNVTSNSSLDSAGFDWIDIHVWIRLWIWLCNFEFPFGFCTNFDLDL